jgi:hypothetical protein
MPCILPIHHSRTFEHPNLIKKPLCFVCKHPRLALQPFLFGSPVTEKILMELCHHHRLLRCSVVGTLADLVGKGPMITPATVF